MIVGLCLTGGLLAVILRAIFKTEKGKQDIMRIFSMLSNEDIKRVYDLCDMYLDNFDENCESDEDQSESGDGIEN